MRSPAPSLILAALLPFAAPWALAGTKAPSAGQAEKYPGSFFHKLGNQIYFGQPSDSGRLQADAATFKVTGEKDFDFQYLSPLGADKDAFFLAKKRIPFPQAHQARILAPNNNGDCMYLIAAGGRLLRINENDKAVEPVQGKTHLSSLEAIPTKNRYAAPMYFKDKGAVYFYDIHANIFRSLPQADPATFQGHVEVYGFKLYWALDKAHAYAGAQLIEGAQRSSFEHIGWVYAKDAKRVYVLSNEKWSTIPDADPESFNVVRGRGVDAQDKNHAYRMGKPVD